MQPSSFHSFVDESAVAAGWVKDFTRGEQAVSFSYTYDWLGVHVQGQFSGTMPSGQLVGTWRETSTVEINGRNSWRGEAEFRFVEGPGRCTLLGSWTPKGEGRATAQSWVVDVQGYGRSISG